MTFNISDNRLSNFSWPIIRLFIVLHNPNFFPYLVSWIPLGFGLEDLYQHPYLTDRIFLGGEECKLGSLPRNSVPASIVRVFIYPVIPFHFRSFPLFLVHYLYLHTRRRAPFSHVSPDLSTSDRPPILVRVTTVHMFHLHGSPLDIPSLLA